MFASINALIDPVAGHHVTANARLAHADETMSGFDSLTATAPTEALLSWPSVYRGPGKPGVHRLQSPPPVAPK